RLAGAIRWPLDRALSGARLEWHPGLRASRGGTAPVDAMADYYRRRALLRRRAVSPLGAFAISYGDLARLRAHRRALPLHGRAVLRDAGELIRRTIGAGEGNRTLVCSLGSCRSTIELRPQVVLSDFWLRFGSTIMIHALADCNAIGF